ncbi:hypothetical protein PHSY_007283 [Pseudozyma hubeiensis SY62]|uniref:Uncharacterized protein n=1 Tax=Pseudozyma hubeiensis (strain SY62) TaxID=1305764 RepID=R9PNG3_PSEHS|nr:hypothetical protein PHSY_007283 [Pseudozyma hubeiensis SY62]GAC99680.1 hypothetical protein PHSY_007283 [Pseudozyma hubeiensis SY62]
MVDVDGATRRATAIAERTGPCSAPFAKGGRGMPRLDCQYGGMKRCKDVIVVRLRNCNQETSASRRSSTKLKLHILSFVDARRHRRSRIMLASPSAHSRSSRSDDESIRTSDSSIKTPDSSVIAISPRAERHVKMSNEYLYMFPPVPAPRATGAALRDFNLPKPVPMDLGVIDDDAMEAAWEDGSCVDGSSPRLKQGGSFSESVSEDRFEVDALKRQVQQLQMALQLQGQQLAYVESQHGHQRFAPQRPPKATSRPRAFPAQPPPPAAALPRPTHAQQSHTADSLLHHYTQQGPAVAHPYADVNRQRPFSSPQPSVDSDKLEHIDRKLAVLEQLIEAMNVQAHSNPSLPPSRPTTATAAPQQRAPQPTPSPVPATPSLRPKLSSILGLKKPASTNTLTYTHRNSISAISLGGQSCESQTTSTARVSWSRKRTERVEQPKVKVRQGPGRGRITIREPVV